MHTALTIAGSDSGAGAGIQADLKTFAAHGVYGTSAITAITAQNTLGVMTWQAVPADLVTAQIEAVIGDIGADAVKTGMLANAAIVEAVAAAVESLDLANLVVDPVMTAKGGDILLDAEAAATMRAELLPLAFVLTPNIPEAEALAGIAIRSVEDMREAARRILGLGPRVVIVKGGHLPGPESIDVVVSTTQAYELRGERIPTQQTHGTGCTFASAIAANLALGRGVDDAARVARAYVAAALREAPGLGRGHGPLQHFPKRGPASLR